MCELSNACLIISQMLEKSQLVTILKYVSNPAVWFDVGFNVGHKYALSAAA